MSLEKLFENIDSTILTRDMKDSLRESFEDAVNEKVESIVSEKIADIEAKTDEYANYLKEEYESNANDYTDKLDNLDEKAEEYADYLKEEYESKIDDLTEKAEEYIEMMQDEMNENVSNYLDRAIQEFIMEAQDQMCINVDNAKAEAITESFSKHALITGVEVTDIVEAHDNSRVSSKLDDAIEENDRLVNENLSLVSKIKELNEKVNTLIKMGCIKEMTEGMTLIEAKKFENLANLVEFSADTDYLDSLNHIAEAVKGEDDDDDNDDEDKEKSSKKSKINFDNQQVNEDFNSSINERLNRLI